MNLLIHIGYHKTGSSWLQAHVFNNAGARLCAPWKPMEVIEQIILAHPLRTDAGAVRAYFAPGIDAAARSGRVPVLTHEMLSGNPRRCLCRGRINADRLAAAFPDARVLIVIREQQGILLSWYKHHVRAGSAARVHNFARPLDASSGFEPTFALDYFEYDLLISYYQQLFTPEHVLVLPLELLRARQEEFLTRLARFAGARCPGELPSGAANPGFGALTVALRRLANVFGNRDFTTARRSFIDRWTLAALSQFDRRAPRWIHRWHDERLTGAISQAVGDRYAESNRRTSRLIGLDLAEFGYPCSPERPGAQRVICNDDRVSTAV